MKMAFFLVALANVALFMWEYNKSSEQVIENSETRSYADRERIVLVDELDRDGTGGSTEPPYEEMAENRETDVESGHKMTSESKDNESSVEGDDRNQVVVQTGENDIQGCYEVGPFTDSNMFGIWQKQLSGVEAEVRVKSVSRAGQSVSDFLVYYPSADTPEQSAANLQMLKTQGYTDVWVLSQGDEKGGISLGVFKKEERAQAMRAQLQANGIHVEVMPRYKNQVQKFALIKGGSQVQQSLKVLEKTYPEIVVKPENSCSEP